MTKPTKREWKAWACIGPKGGLMAVSKWRPLIEASAKFGRGRTIAPILITLAKPGKRKP